MIDLVISYLKVIVIWRFNKNTNNFLVCKLCMGGNEDQTKQNCFYAKQNVGGPFADR